MEMTMQVESPSSHTGQHIPFKQEGWGVALFVIMLAVAAAGGATYVHMTTYKHPTDVRFHAIGAPASRQ
jgi:cell division protein FtsX